MTAMHRFKRLLTAIFLTLLSVILLFSAVFAYMIVTPLGGKILLRYFKQQFVSVGLMHVGHYEGSLHEGFTLKEVRITGLSYFPHAVLLIQEVDVRLPLWDLSHSHFGIFNARLFLPDSDPIVFTGEVDGGQIKGNLYGRDINIQQAIRFWGNEDTQRDLRGYISDLDVNLQGSLFSPKVSGRFLAEGIRYKSVSVTDAFSTLNLQLTPDRQPLVDVKGEVAIDSGLVTVRRTNLELQASKFIFQGDIFAPMVDIHLASKVEDMEFHLALKGTSRAPQLTVTSDPPMLPQDALRILFTGNAWSTSTTPFNGITSNELAENFLDYSLQDMNDDQQFGLKTKLTHNFKVGAEMDQLPSQPGETSVYYNRKINGELDLDEHMSLNVSRQVMPQDSYPVASYQDAQPETQVYVQYKKRF